MNKKHIILLALIIGAGSLNAQSLRRFKTKATEAFVAKDYSRALEYYQMIINEAEDETAENYYNAAEAAREFRIYGEAEKYYRQVLSDSAAAATYQLTNYHLGSVLKNQGRYEEAKYYYQHFLDKNVAFVSESFTAKAQKEISDCDWAMTLQESGETVIQMDSTVNTPNSEFSPILLGNDLYFSSVRYKTDANHNPKAPLTRIYVSKDSQLGQQIDEDFNEDLMHSADATFNQDASRVYYTICSSINAVEVRCKIYYREKNGDKWGNRVALSNTINQEGFTATQPNIGFDKSTGKEVLFFVSDRPVDANDTQKDLNIWCSFREGDYFGQPAYIANVNTNEDDVTPFFDTESQTLYFSSNGRQNMGGFDIYAANRYGDGWEAVNHLGTPINSSYDDLYYSLNSEGTVAYLSSNRKGATCDDENGLCGCNDIFEVAQIKIKVLTFNAITKEPLFGTTVTLEELKTQTSRPQSKPDDYKYDYSGRFNLEYKVDATLEGWVFDDSLFNTMNVQGGSVIEIPLYLTPAVELDALTFNKITGKPLAGVKVELYEVENDLYEEYDSLTAQEDRLSVQYNYGLNFGKKYMVVGSKDGYSRDTFYVTTQGIPVVPTKLLDKLYLCKTPPGPDLVKLYFYNDEPDRRTRKTTTNWSYTRALDSYLSLRQDFTVAFAYDPEELSKIEKFFEEDVKGGYRDLEEFTRLLKNSYLDQMNEGDTLVVIIKGYASPRANSDYNKNLTKRRIKSIENYFNTHELLPKYAGRILVEEEANGEEKAPSGIIDDIADRKNSIFSVAASRERRVEIVRILVAPDSCTAGQKR